MIENKSKLFLVFLLIVLLMNFPSASAFQIIEPDSIIPDIYNPQSLNRYNYADEEWDKSRVNKDEQ